MSFCTLQSSGRLGGMWNVISDEIEPRFGEFSVPPSTGWAGSSGLASLQPPLFVIEQSLFDLVPGCLPLLDFCSGFFMFTVAIFGLYLWSVWRLVYHRATCLPVSEGKNPSSNHRDLCSVTELLENFHPTKLRICLKRKNTRTMRNFRVKLSDDVNRY